MTLWLQILIISSVFIITNNAVNAEQNADTTNESEHPSTVDLGNIDYLVRKTTMNSWSEWISENPSNCLSVLKTNYLIHRANPEIRLRLKFLIKQIMIKHTQKVKLGVSFKEKTVILDSGLEILAMRVTGVKKGSDSHKAGILAGDLLIGFNTDSAENDENATSVKLQLAQIKINTPVKIYVIREEKKMVLNAQFTTYLPSKKSDEEHRLKEFENTMKQLDRRDS